MTDEEIMGAARVLFLKAAEDPEEDDGLKASLRDAASACSYWIHARPAVRPPPLSERELELLRAKLREEED